MSYLNVPRLTFSGDFQADPSTVNNDPIHFNNETFEPDFQNYSTADAQNGWWNPDGTGNWRFIGCKVTTVTYQDGSSTSDPQSDPIIGMSIMDTDSRTAGKIVDLDSQQQMVSELWGFIVRIVSQDGTNMMKGDYEVAPFTNIWFNRSVDKSADSAACAIYQSVVKNITWNDAYSNSRYLNELRDVSANELSIQFNVDRYNGDHTSAQSTLGRIVGCIGPYNIVEPKQIVLDFGNSLQFSTGGVVHESRDLHLVIDTGNSTKSSFVEIGKINYSNPNWYMETSGICTFLLTEEQIKLAQNNPLAIVKVTIGSKDVFAEANIASLTPVFNESVEYVRADKFVFRLEPDDKCSVSFYASKLGKRYADAEIIIQDDTQNFLGPTPPVVGVPSIPQFQFGNQTVVKTGENGKAVLTFDSFDPGNPRVYIDGQVYGLSYRLSNQSFDTCNQSNFISVLIFSGAPATDIVPDWDNFIQPIMQQYANLYPLMSKGIFNLANKSVVDNNAEILKLVFSKDREDSNYMPATRDLSAYKTKVILEYLQNIIDKKTTENQA
jgi:hypothetical protein